MHDEINGKINYFFILIFYSLKFKMCCLQVSSNFIFPIIFQGIYGNPTLQKQIREYFHQFLIIRVNLIFSTCSQATNYYIEKFVYRFSSVLLNNCLKIFFCRPTLLVKFYKRLTALVKKLYTTKRLLGIK